MVRNAFRNGRRRNRQSGLADGAAFILHRVELCAGFCGQARPRALFAQGTCRKRGRDRHEGLSLAARRPSGDAPGQARQFPHLLSGLCSVDDRVCATARLQGQRHSRVGVLVCPFSMLEESVCRFCKIKLKIYTKCINFPFNPEESGLFLFQRSKREKEPKREKVLSFTSFFLHIHLFIFK